MSGKKLIFAIAAIIAAVLVIVIGEQLGKKNPSEKSLLFFPGLTEKDISSVEIFDSNGKVRIQRKGDVWVLGSGNTASAAPVNPVIGSSSSTPSSDKTEYQADSSSLVSVLEKVVAIKRDQLISTNPEKQSLFEVDSAKGVHVEIFDQSGKSRGSFRIGKNGPDYSSCYVRMTGSNEVYMVGGNIRYSFFTDNKRWRDKIVLKFEQTAVQNISIMKKDGSKIVLQKDSTNWSIKEPVQAPAKSSEMQSILSSLSRMTASDIDSISLEDTAAGFANPELAIAVTFKNGTTRNVLFGSKNSANQYHVKADGKAHVYLVGEYEFNKYNITADKLKDEPAPAADTSKAAPVMPTPMVKKTKKK
jgi:hypothetical protein